MIKLFALQKNMRQNRKIGMIDGLIFLTFWSAIGMASAPYWYGALPVIIFILIPISALVSWRGARSVENIKEEKLSIKTSAIEGGLCGFLVTFAISLWSYSAQVYAAGTLFDNVQTNNIELYERIVEAYLPIVSGGILSGALHGMFFYKLNQKLIKIIS